MYAHVPEADLQLTLMSDNLESAINMSPRPLNDPNCVTQLMEILEAILNSDETLELNKSLRISAIVTKIPRPLVGAVKPELGRAFNLPEFSNSKFHHFSPILPGLKKACFLVSLVTGVIFNRYLKANVNNKTCSYQTKEWKEIKDLTREDQTHPNVKKAKRVLRQKVFEFCEEFDLDVRDFHLSNLEDLRPTLDRLNLNVHVYSVDAAYLRVFTHPLKFDPERQTISLLLGQNTHTDVLHCGVIRRVNKFFASRGERVCEHCGNSYSVPFFKFHKCDARESCKMCRMAYAKESDYLHFDLRKEHCLSRIAPSEPQRCDKCNKDCLTDECYKAHKTECDKKKLCDVCGSIYKDAVKGYQHRCGDFLCPICRRFYK